MRFAHITGKLPGQRKEREFTLTVAHGDEHTHTFVVGQSDDSIFVFRLDPPHEGGRYSTRGSYIPYLSMPGSKPLYVEPEFAARCIGALEEAKAS